ncbi:MAG: alpha/beta hydrolase [Actinomycetota bacterium]|nr:alpha/beta hydrolase [Actinomycetota bacterium]
MVGGEHVGNDRVGGEHAAGGVGHGASEPGASAGTVHHERHGDGVPLVLVHDRALTAAAWDGEVASLAEDHDVVRYDLRGHGRSPAVRGDFSHVDDLRSLLDHLALERAVLVGAGLGARIAVDAALTHPERVHGLVLASPELSGARYRDPYVLAHNDRLRDAAGSTNAPDVIELLLRLWVDGPHRTAGQTDAAVRDRCRSLYEESLSTLAAGTGRSLELRANDRLAELELPVRVLVGELATSDVHDAAALLVAKVRGASVGMLAGVGHQVNLEAPGPFTNVVREFTDRVRTTAADHTD